MTNEKNTKLGKGLSSLLSGKSFIKNKNPSFIGNLNNEIKIGITKLTPNPNQPRKNFIKEELENLASSIKEKGIIQPIIVRKHPTSDNYEIIAGERRWRAAQIAGLHDVPVITRDFSDTEVLEIALVENLQREDLNPVEEAKAYKILLEKLNYKQDQLSKTVGKSRSHIANMMRLLSLSENILNYLIDQKLTMGHARSLIGVENADELAKNIIVKKLSVRQTEKLIGGIKNKKANKITAKEDSNIADLERELSEKIGLKTTINFSEKSTSGSITVYYSNLDQLDDVMRRLKLSK